MFEYNEYHVSTTVKQTKKMCCSSLCHTTDFYFGHCHVGLLFQGLVAGNKTTG